MVRQVRPGGAARLVVVDGVVSLRPAEAMFEAMLDGWAAQQRSRTLAPGTIEARLQIVRRFATFTGTWPWEWTPADVEDWASDLLSRPGTAPTHSTVRNYQNELALFCGYLIDPRYDWAEQCEQRFGTHPVQILHEWNIARHTVPYEGRPEVRPLTRQELQALFDHADDNVRPRADGRAEGLAPAFRDATLFKALYGWGLRRREAAMLDTVDFGRNSVPWDLIVKAVEANTDQRWVVLYVKPWLQAPTRLPDGTIAERDRGPQGSAVSPVLANLFLHYAFDTWMARDSRPSRSNATWMTRSCTASVSARPAMS